MASEGPNFPDTGTDDDSFGSFAWANPGRIIASDDTNVAQVTLSTQGDISHYLKATDFDFAIPDGAVVSGILVEIEQRCAQENAIRDERVRIVKGGVIGTTDKADLSGWPTSDTFRGYGGASDLWGETWSSADINATTFGCVIAATKFDIGGARTAVVDSIRITITYADGRTPPISAMGFLRRGF